MRLALASLLLLAPALSFAITTTAIRDVTLIDGTGAPPQPHSTIVFRGERIIALGPLGRTRIPKAARIINGGGKFVIPGLWDMHVHLWDKENVLPLYVAFGVTGVRDMGSNYTRTTAWRKEIEDGKTIGPHIVTCGPPVDGAESRDDKLPVITVKSPEDARKAFDRLDGMDVDFVKILSTLPRQAFFALTEQCRHWRVQFAGHLPDDVRASEALEERMGSMEHLFGLFLACSTEELGIRAGKTPRSRMLDTFSENRARELFRKSALFETRQTPTLTLWERMACLDPGRLLNNAALRYVPAAIRKTWPSPDDEITRTADPELAEMRKQFALAKKMVGLMKECGVQILAGTDTGDPYTVPGASLDRELELLVQAGLTPAEALRSATVEATKFLGWDESIGTLKPGMVADLVLLDADPLSDIRNVSKVAGVAVRGVYVTPASILKNRQTPSAPRKAPKHSE
jgi:imidazolonepropionase-like amidohydrolase